MTSNRIPYLIFVFVLLVFSTALVSKAQADPFAKGSRRGSIVAGTSQTNNNSYTIIGLGAGYYVFDGLELGLDAEAWMGGDPDIYKLSPHIKYVLPLQMQVRPYGGVFYRHIFIDGFDDKNSTGVRGGLYFTSNNNWFLGVGAVYESYLDCEETYYTDCDYIYSEITFSLSF